MDIDLTDFSAAQQRALFDLLILSVHFLPLKVDPNETTPQGFNGGHLHHPISDPPPQGLGLTSTYVANDDYHLREDPAKVTHGSRVASASSSNSRSSRQISHCADRTGIFVSRFTASHSAKTPASVRSRK